MELEQENIFRTLPLIECASRGCNSPYESGFSITCTFLLLNAGELTVLTCTGILFNLIQVCSGEGGEVGGGVEDHCDRQVLE